MLGWIPIRCERPEDHRKRNSELLRHSERVGKSADQTGWIRLDKSAELCELHNAKPEIRSDVLGRPERRYPPLCWSLRATAELSVRTVRTKPTLGAGGGHELAQQLHAGAR